MKKTIMRLIKKIWSFLFKRLEPHDILIWDLSPNDLYHLREKETDYLIIKAMCTKLGMLTEDGRCVDPRNYNIDVDTGLPYPGMFWKNIKCNECTCPYLLIENKSLGVVQDKNLLSL